jgi:hypothetical protein
MQSYIPTRNFHLPCVNSKNYEQHISSKPEGKRPLGRPRRRWIDNIKMDLLDIGLGVVDWIGLDKDRYR